jgi:hypothetical protein
VKVFENALMMNVPAKEQNQRLSTGRWRASMQLWFKLRTSANFPRVKITASEDV